MTIPKDLKAARKYDRSNMLGLVESFPEQCALAKKIGDEFLLPASFKFRYKNIVATGLGGSGIGADIARSYIIDELSVPFIVNRDYLLPAFVNEESLVVVISYSGNTEETLSAYKDAKAKRSKVVVITSGGQLKKIADRDGFPVLSIPSGIPPRAAVGYSSLTLIILLSKAGLVEDKSRYIDEMIEVLGSLKDKNNMAKDIARFIYRRYPVIYGSQRHTDAVVTRWRGQIAENSKTLSSSQLFPELTHNEIVGWDNPKRVLKNTVVIMLKDRDDHPAVSKRMEITKKILKGLKVKVIEVSSEGRGLLARIFSLVYIGDLVSYYLALFNRCDPTPVERIAYFKKELAKS